MLQSLFKFVSYEVAVIGPSLKTFSNQVVRKSFKFAIAVFHLIVLSVEDHRLLNLFDISLVKDVFTNAQLFETEVGLQSVPYLVSAMLCDATIENFKLN